jgi:hypothetical protein
VIVNLSGVPAATLEPEAGTVAGDTEVPEPVAASAGAEDGGVAAPMTVHV